MSIIAGDTVEVLVGLRMGEYGTVYKIEKVGGTHYYSVKFDDGTKGVFSQYEVQLEV